MAEKDLKKLSKSIDKIIEREKKRSRGILNKQNHIYTVSSTTFAEQLTRQLINIRKFCPLTDSQYEDKITELANEYTEDLYDSLDGIGGVKFSASTKDNFKATLSNEHHPSPFNAFQNARRIPVEKLKSKVIESLFDKFTSNQDYIDYTKMSDEDLLRIKNDVKAKTKKVLATPGSNLEKYEMLSSRILGSYRQIKEDDNKIQRDTSGSIIRSRGMTDLGHAKSVAVNKLVLPIIANAIIEGTIEKEIRSLGVKYSIGSSVKKATDGTPTAKTFEVTVEVFDESSSQNRGDGSTERSELKRKTDLIKDKIFEEIMKNDWANQDSSPSFMRLAKSHLLRSASKMERSPNTKFQVDKSLIVPTNISPTELAKILKGNKGSKNVVASGKNSKVVPKVATKKPRNTEPKKRAPNWLRLLPLINAKLADQVMKNMRAPRLVNRTGTFANSAKVINVEQTREGFPSFVFDYERDPYDVFDRTKGRSPWNTPERDPRTLVDISIREIVREMAIGRFFTRRA
jgi:hypothetical protein